MTLNDERYEDWEEEEYLLDEEDLNFMHEVDDFEDEEEYGIEVLDTSGEYLGLDIQFECSAPIWSVLDTVSEFFETRGLKTAEIVSMTTEIFDDDTLLLRVIYTV